MALMAHLDRRPMAAFGATARIAQRAADSARRTDAAALANSDESLRGEEMAAARRTGARRHNQRRQCYQGSG
jgi:hypothetical protein